MNAKIQLAWNGVKTWIACARRKKQRWIFWIGIAACIGGVAFITLGSITTYQAHRSRIIRLKMEDIGELSTQAAYFTNVQVISNSRELFGMKIPLTQNKYIFSYDGVIKAGIDFTKLTYTVDSLQKVITVHLPEPYITGISVDEESLEIYDETNNIFTPLKLTDFEKSRQAMEAEAQEQAIANGLLEETLENAKVLIRAFLFSDASLADHEIIWIHQEEAEK